ncbi:MAG: hypothetical protein R3B81_07165 [bacterium]
MNRKTTSAALGSLAVTAALIGGAGSVAAEVPAPGLAGIRPLGMGNAFIAAADDRNALYYNPAMLFAVKGTSVSGLGVQARLDEAFNEVVNFINEHEQQFEDFDTIDATFYEELAPFDNKWVTAGASAYVDMVRPGMGFGVYSSGSGSLKIDRGVYEPRVSSKVIDDIVATAGAAMPLGRADITAGASVKSIWRRSSDRVLTAREVADFDPNDILNELEQADSGFSMDFGAAWQRPESRWTAAAVVRDAFGYIDGEPIDTALDLGGAFRPVRNAGVVREVLFAADARDVFGGESLAQAMRLGVEVRFPRLAFRGGFHQGYSSLGASFRVPILTLDYAWYGQELGAFPGAERQNLHALEMRLGF